MTVTTAPADQSEALFDTDPYIVVVTHDGTRSPRRGFVWPTERRQQLRLDNLLLAADLCPGERCPKSGALIVVRRGPRERKAPYHPDWVTNCGVCGHEHGMTKKSRIPVHRVPRSARP